MRGIPHITMANSHLDGNTYEIFSNDFVGVLLLRVEVIVSFCILTDAFNASSFNQRPTAVLRRRFIALWFISPHTNIASFAFSLLVANARERPACTHTRARSQKTFSPNYAWNRIIPMNRDLMRCECQPNEMLFGQTQYWAKWVNLNVINAYVHTHTKNRSWNVNVEKWNWFDLYLELNVSYFLPEAIISPCKTRG